MHYLSFKELYLGRDSQMDSKHAVDLGKTQYTEV